jgi:microcystin degradation protein MlrC
MRVGIASIIQETNTFSVSPSTLEDFTIATNEELLDLVAGTNSELAGALRALEERKTTAVPLLYAWGMPSGRLTEDAFQELRSLLIGRLERAGQLDALMLSLHGSMAAEACDDADGELIAAAREVMGPGAPIAVSLDLHANVTRRIVEVADTISAYHTDPHVDMADAGFRAATRAMSMAATDAPFFTGFAKRPMIMPAETMNTETGILAGIRSEAMSTAPDDMLELCLFPVQPWLDVPELGLSVVVTTSGNKQRADEFAEEVASRIWQRREEFVVERLMEPAEALRIASSSSVRPFVIAESADAPTAGATGDSPAMIAASIGSKSELITYVPVVDPEAVSVCHVAGSGRMVQLRVGACRDRRWWTPVDLEGEVLGLGEGTYRLTGASFTGMEVSMGRYATLKSGSLRLLLSERTAWTSDPATYRLAGLPPEEADVIVVRSCSDYRPNFPESAPYAVTLDVPGAATPRLTDLHFESMSRPPYPLDPWHELS